MNLCDKPIVAVPDDYFSRKMHYGLHLQITCDMDLKIRQYAVGRTASAHDARVFNESLIATKANDYFSPGEWIAGDSAYKITETVITPFRRNSSDGRKKDRKKFNRTISKF